LEDGQTSISSCGEQRTEDNRIARFPDIPEHGSDDGGASSRGGFIREIWQVPEFSERSQVQSNVPANIVEKPTGKGTVGDWTFGSSPHPQKCSLTCLQGHNEMEPNITEGIG